MADSPKLGSSVLVGVVVFVAATAWLAVEVMPGAFDTSTRVFEPVPTQARMIPASDSLAPNEALVTYTPPAPDSDDPQPAPSMPPPKATAQKATAQKATARKGTAHKVPAPAMKRAVTPARPADTIATNRTSIIVEEQRLSHDERIQHLVMQRLASNPRLAGKIAVESKDAVVRLSGWTYTVAQARRAEQDARSVQSVRQVRNEIRARIGGSV